MPRSADCFGARCTKQMSLGRSQTRTRWSAERAVLLRQIWWLQSAHRLHIGSFVCRPQLQGMVPADCMLYLPWLPGEILSFCIDGLERPLCPPTNVFGCFWLIGLISWESASCCQSSWGLWTGIFLKITCQNMGQFRNVNDGRIHVWRLLLCCFVSGKCASAAASLPSSVPLDCCLISLTFYNSEKSLAWNVQPACLNERYMRICIYI
jgi:hypothetical protein